jgi:hypothetical protein
MLPFDSIFQAAMITIFAILCILFFVFSALLTSKTKKREQEEKEDLRSTPVSQDPLDDENLPEDDEIAPTPSEEALRAEARRKEEADYYAQQKKEREEQERRKREEEASIRPIYEKYPEIFRFEILYWRAVSKPWWWNNYAKDLVEYANEYFPWNKVDYYSSYNSNSKSEDYSYPPFHDRILRLRPHKISKHPLVVINYDQEYIMVDSYYALQEMMDRIDAEWYRQYGFKKTYRHSPLTYRVR